MALYKVKNLKEGSRPGNWLKFWKDSVGIDDEMLIECHRWGCKEIATDGAHVYLADPNAVKKWYIVPLCNPHNCTRDEEFTVLGPLVPVNGGDILW